ncbi:MAG: hypothetical protein ABI685_06245 [Ferruginibacter sp.]
MGKPDNDENNYPQYRPFPLYAILICGLLIAIVGIYLIAVNQSANGTTFPGRMGTGGGKPISINGPAILIIGLLICIFPVYQLIKNNRGRK